MRLILLLWAGGWVEYGRVFVGKEGLGERGGGRRREGDGRGFSCEKRFVGRGGGLWGM